MIELILMPRSRKASISTYSLDKRVRVRYYSFSCFYERSSSGFRVNTSTLLFSVLDLYIIIKLYSVKALA